MSMTLQFSFDASTAFWRQMNGSQSIDWLGSGDIPLLV